MRTPSRSGIPLRVPPVPKLDDAALKLFSQQIRDQLKQFNRVLPKLPELFISNSFLEGGKVSRIGFCCRVVGYKRIRDGPQEFNPMIKMRSHPSGRKMPVTHIEVHPPKGPWSAFDLSFPPALIKKQGRPSRRRRTRTKSADDLRVNDLFLRIRLRQMREKRFQMDIDTEDFLAAPPPVFAFTFGCKWPGSLDPMDLDVTFIQGPPPPPPHFPPAASQPSLPPFLPPPPPTTPPAQHLPHPTPSSFLPPPPPQPAVTWAPVQASANEASRDPRERPLRSTNSGPTVAPIARSSPTAAPTPSPMPEATASASSGARTSGESMRPFVLSTPSVVGFYTSMFAELPHTNTTPALRPVGPVGPTIRSVPQSPAGTRPTPPPTRLPARPEAAVSARPDKGKGRDPSERPNAPSASSSTGVYGSTSAGPSTSASTTTSAAPLVAHETHGTILVDSDATLVSSPSSTTGSELQPTAQSEFAARHSAPLLEFPTAPGASFTLGHQYLSDGPARTNADSAPEFSSTLEDGQSGSEPRDEGNDGDDEADEADDDMGLTGEEAEEAEEEGAGDEDGSAEDDGAPGAGNEEDAQEDERARRRKDLELLIFGSSSDEEDEEDEGEMGTTGEPSGPSTPGASSSADGIAGGSSSVNFSRRDRTERDSGDESDAETAAPPRGLAALADVSDSDVQDILMIQQRRRRHAQQAPRRGNASQAPSPSDDAPDAGDGSGSAGLDDLDALARSLGGLVGGDNGPPANQRPAAHLPRHVPTEGHASSSQTYRTLDRNTDTGDSSPFRNFEWKRGTNHPR